MIAMTTTLTLTLTTMMAIATTVSILLGSGFVMVSASSNNGGAPNDRVEPIIPVPSAPQLRYQSTDFVGKQREGGNKTKQNTSCTACVCVCGNLHALLREDLMMLCYTSGTSSTTIKYDTLHAVR